MLNNNLRGVTYGKIVKYTLFLAVILFCAPSYAQQKGSGTSYTDTFKLADRYIAKKRFRRAARLYAAYHRDHPGDVNVVWKLAQVKLWMSNNRQSNEAYKEALKLNPKNDNLNLNYIHSLLDMGKLGEAGSRLTDMELAGKDYPDMSLLRAKLSYYQGDFKKAAAYMKKDLKLENNNPESQELNDMIEMARSPLVAADVSYLTDDQPLSVLISTIKAEAYFHKYATFYIIADEYHFTQGTGADAPWVRIGDKLFFPDAGIHMNIGAGVVRFPVKNQTAWSGNIAFNKKISSQFDADLSLDHVPYLDTKSSVDSDVSATRFAAMLNWHARGWNAQAAFLNSTYEDNNNVYGVYAWVLAPLARFTGGQLQGGYSVSYSNSTESAYKPVLPLSELIANYPVNPTVGGIYDPYFSPNELFTNSVLLSLSLHPSKVVSINLSGDVGYGTISNPYLYLSNGGAANSVVNRGFSNESFVPANATAALNFHVARTWTISARYTYHNSYFFSSNFVGLGIQKSFQHRRKAVSGNGSSTFSRLIKEIEAQVQGLAGARSPQELKSSVSNLRGRLVKLRDTEKRRKDETEVAPGSDEATNLQDHYDALTDMINELDSVDLDDYDANSGSKKKWLADKLSSLTSIHYLGSTHD